MACHAGAAGLLLLSLSAELAAAWVPHRPASPLPRSATRAGAAVAGAGAPNVIDSLKGCEAFERVNPMSDIFVMKGFHHVELYTADATHTAARWSFGLGMPVVARSGPATGNSACSSVLLQSGGMRFLFSAPLRNGTGCPLRGYDADAAAAFVAKHGVAVRAVGLEVEDAREAYERCVAAGGVGVLPPYAMAATDDVGGDSGESVWVAEVQLYGDVVLRFVSTGGYDGAFLPGFEAEDGARTDETFGLKRLDHLVGNVWELLPRANYVAQSTGLHQFAEFTAEDVGTVDSGLNSLVLASNDGNVLLPMNEPTYGTRRKSQIQTYLEQNEGEGVQHMALLTDDIFTTIRSIRSMTRFGGFQLMGRPSDAYYRELPGRLGDALTPDEYAQVEELGLLADLDDAGVLLQVFTRPVGDRPTLFLEIIQRIGCIDEKGAQEAGCGGFGKGNFR